MAIDKPNRSRRSIGRGGRRSESFQYDGVERSIKGARTLRKVRRVTSSVRAYKVDLMREGWAIEKERLDEIFIRYMRRKESHGVKHAPVVTFSKAASWSSD
jgi:hypothetical protein